MTIAGYDALYVLTVVIVTLGALTFCVLTLHYWREGASRRDPVFTAFTLTCAAAFLINVLVRMEPRWETPLSAALDGVTGLIPALLFHLVSQGRRRRLTAAFYAVSAAVAVALILDDVSPLAVPFRDQLPAILLAASALLSLLFIAPGDGRLRLGYRLLLGLMAVVSVAGLVWPSPVTALAPDYLLLAFFCVTLYCRQRVIFFDLLIKRGVFFGFAFAALALLLSAAHVSDRLTLLLLLMPLWLVAPWIESALARLVDRLFLRRRYSPLEAERRVLGELQLAGTEEDLRRRAEGSLSVVFGCRAEVRFEWPAGPAAEASMAATMPGLGQVILNPRAAGIPYMTDDRRLLDSLARSLGMVLENVRFREQQGRHHQREQHLRLLATRAELKALRAQINPHFLFSALNTVAAYLPAQPAMAEFAIEQLAQIFRYTLRKSEREWARLDEEAEFAAAYLRMEQARFGERLRVELSVDPAAQRVSVPAMCIQPLIENAIRHGASTVEGQGLVQLRIGVNDAMAWIEVCDNGPGFPPAFSLEESAGHGLRNVAERLKGYYGDSARLGWECGSNLTRVLMQIPREPAVTGEAKRPTVPPAEPPIAREKGAWR